MTVLYDFVITKNFARTKIKMRKIKIEDKNSFIKPC